MLLFLVSLAHAARFTETSLQTMAVQLAPEVEAAAGRRFLEVPPIVIDDTAHILVTAESLTRGEGPEVPLAAPIRETIQSALAVYVNGETTIFVNSDRVGAFLSAMESWKGSAEAHMRCVMAHELTHALQHQRGESPPPDEAGTLLLEGHATWVAAQVCDPRLRDIGNAATGTHLLQSALLKPAQRPYVVGEAAVSTLLAGAGTEAFWSTLNGARVSAEELDDLADGRRQPGVDPDQMGNNLSFAATWGKPSREVEHSYITAAKLLDPSRHRIIAGGGPAVVLKWIWEGMEAAAVDLAFYSAEVAEAVLDGRRGAFSSLYVPTLFPLGGYAGISVVPRLPAKSTPVGSLGGFSATARLLAGGPYRELWSQQGGHLRGVVVRGPVPLKEVRAALLEWSGLPLPGPAPGPAAPRAAAVLARLRALPPASPDVVSTSFLGSRIRSATRNRGDCLAVYRKLEPHVRPRARGGGAGRGRSLCPGARSDRGAQGAGAHPGAARAVSPPAQPSMANAHASQSSVGPARGTKKPSIQGTAT